MVDFTKLLEQMRNESPADRERRLAEQDARWRAQTQQKLDTLRAQVEKAAALQGLGGEERRFVDSLVLKSERTELITDLVGGELLSLTERQLGWLEKLARRAEAPQPAAGSRAQRYGAQRG